MGRVMSQGMPRPAVWVKNAYPPGAAGDQYHDIPYDDQRYITLVFEVERRMPRQEAHYDKEQVEALREIARKL
jgi:hypothetical protein